MTIITLIMRFVRQKQNCIILFADSSKAFDNMDTTKLSAALKKAMPTNIPLAYMITQRLNNFAYVTIKNNEQLIQYATEGVPQGDPTSPPVRDFST